MDDDGFIVGLHGATSQSMSSSRVEVEFLLLDLLASVDENAHDCQISIEIL